MNTNISTYDGVSGIAIAVFILVVVFNGKGKALIDALKGEAGFLKWILALFILRYIGDSGMFGEAGHTLLIGVYLLLLMKIAQNQEIVSGIKKFWNSF